MNLELMIARVCHEANRAYCKSVGDESQVEWEVAPEWQKESALKGVHFHLDHLVRGKKADPSASHECWLREKRETGWSYGPVKDAEKKLHPCFLPYEKLPFEQRVKDYIFAYLVEAFYVADMVEYKAQK